MSKIHVYRGCRAVLNIHERALPAPLEAVGALLEGLGSDRDRLWPLAWPPMVLDRGLEPGSCGGHSLIRYRVLEHLPGQRVAFLFEPMAHLGRFEGRHGFEVFGRGDRTILRHTLDVAVDLRTWIRWKLSVEPLHDGVPPVRVREIAW